MSGVDIAGLALASVDAALKIFEFVKDSYVANEQNPKDILSLHQRSVRIQENLINYETSAVSSSIPTKVFQRIVVDFDEITEKLMKVRRRVSSSRKAIAWFTSKSSAAAIKSISVQLLELEDHLDMYGLMSDMKSTLQYELTTAFTSAVAKKAEEFQNCRKDDSKKIAKQLSRILSLLSTTDSQTGDRSPVTLLRGSSSRSIESTCEVLDNSEPFYIAFATLPTEVYRLLDRLSTSGVSREIQKGLVRDLNNSCDGWNIRDEDVLFAQKPNGRNVLLGSGSSGDVYQAKLLRKDAAPLRVAVKQLKIAKDELDDRKVEVLREVFLQMDSQHDCILKICGAHWPDDSEDWYSAPYIVMERMTCNLRTAMREGLVATLELQLRVLLDVARALVYLHERRIVHRDVKPENILLRVVDGEIVGNTKLSDFGTSRRFRRNPQGSTLTVVKDSFGTVSFMPPEVLSDIENCPSRRSWDVWSFGVLICAMASTDSNSFSHLRAVTVQKFAESGKLQKLADSSASKISDLRLQEVARACLRENADERPAMIDVEKVLRAKDPGPDVLQLLKPREVLASNVGPEHFDNQEEAYARRRPSERSLNLVLTLENQRERSTMPRPRRPPSEIRPSRFYSLGARSPGSFQWPNGPSLLSTLTSNDNSTVSGYLGSIFELN